MTEEQFNTEMEELEEALDNQEITYGSFLVEARELETEFYGYHPDFKNY